MEFPDQLNFANQSWVGVTTALRREILNIAVKSKSSGSENKLLNHAAALQFSFYY